MQIKPVPGELIQVAPSEQGFSSHIERSHNVPV